MEITQRDDRTGGEFTAIENGEKVGKLVYTWAGIDKLLIKHTQTEQGHRLQGIGHSLVKATVDFARNKKIKILPLCSFARQEFREHNEWKDVLF